MIRVKAIAPLVILAMLAVSGAAYAQQPAAATSKIAIVDSNKAFETSIEGKKVQAQLQDQSTKIRADIQKMEDAIRLLENKLSTGRLTMTQDALLGIQADIEKKQTDRKRYEEDKAREFQQLQINLTNRLRDEMVQIIKKILAEKGLDLVLDLGTSGIVDYNLAIDITEEVVKRYDQAKTAAPPVKK